MRLRDEGMHLRDEGMHLRDNGMQLRNKGMHLRDNGMHLRDKGMHLRDTGTHSGASVVSGTAARVHTDADVALCSQAARRQPSFESRAPSLHVRSPAHRRIDPTTRVREYSVRLEYLSAVVLRIGGEY